jgi:hypothetical protein
MATASRRFVLEILVDTVTVGDIQKKESILSSDVRLSIALSDFPIVHIKPSSLVHNNNSLEDRLVFGGSGKLCEFSMKKPEVESSYLTILLLKEITSLNDYLILCMTAPISFHELLLSLPSCSPQPFVKRQFEFIDNRGCCEIYIRLSTVEPSRSIRKTPRPVSTRPSPPERPQTPKQPPKKQDSMQYGGFRNRPSIIH